MTSTATREAPARHDIVLPASGQWCLYLIECSNGAWYAGITNCLTTRYAAHAAGRGARYTRANPPRRLLGWRPYPDRASASRAEAAIKKLEKARKLPFLLGDAGIGKKS
jgi:putative endonuclease